MYNNAGTIDTLVDRDPLTCEPWRLRGHIVNEHLVDPVALLHVSGVPLWDIGLAAYRQIDLSWVVKKIYQRLEQSDEYLETKLGEHNLHSETADAYREMLVKTLYCIEQYGTASVDWERAKESYPRALEAVFDPEDDSYVDSPFDPNKLQVTKS